MPNIIEAARLTSTVSGGIARTVLASRATLGSGALQVERVTLESGTRTSASGTPAGENFVYVIRGSGRARVGAQVFELQPESVLWLEAGDRCSLEAGAEALEVLLCRAPAAD
jgi:quercetin dioxygenase-like cupin family protein